MSPGRAKYSMPLGPLGPARDSSLRSKRKISDNAAAPFTPGQISQTLERNKYSYRLLLTLERVGISESPIPLVLSRPTFGH